MFESTLIHLKDQVSNVNFRQGGTSVKLGTACLYIISLPSRDRIQC